LEEILEKNPPHVKKHSSGKEKVAKKLAKLRMKTKPVKNEDSEDQSNQVSFFHISLSFYYIFKAFFGNTFQGVIVRELGGSSSCSGDVSQQQF
jgi:hypothetical protein